MSNSQSKFRKSKSQNFDCVTHGESTKNDQIYIYNNIGVQNPNASGKSSLYNQRIFELKRQLK